MKTAKKIDNYEKFEFICSFGTDVCYADADQLQREVL